MAARPIPSAFDVERAFADEMARLGFMPGPIQSDTDKFVRFDGPGDKKGRSNGYYKLRLGTYPIGWFGDWKQGEGHEWVYFDPDHPAPDAKEREKIRKEHKRLKIEAEQVREARQAEVAEDASAMWKRATSDVAGHPYLVRKKIELPRGVRNYLAKDGTRLLAVPIYAFDMNGQAQLVNLQMIDPDGSKRFLTSGRVEGCFFSIKGSDDVIVLCEGYATGQVIWEATGFGVVVCFNAGNLVRVANVMRDARPSMTFLVCGDDDVMAPPDWAKKSNGRPWVNEGRKKAEKAAQAAKCRWIVPHFKAGPARDRTDFDDLAREEGKEAVGRQVAGAFRTIEVEGQEEPVARVEIKELQDESWRSKVPQTSGAKDDGTNVEGVAIYIANHRLLRGRLRFNQLTKETELDGNHLEDRHVAEFRRIMHADGMRAKKGDVQDEMDADARKNGFDPLVEYLAALKWDGTPRCDRWLSTYCGAADNAYTRDVGAKTLIGSVARAMLPGCKMETMLVLEGDQGIGKSTALRYLYGDRFFIDQLPDFHSKDAFMQLQGAWCVECGELAAYGKAEVKDVKLFLSVQADKFRPPYGRNTIIVPRRVVINGTVNPEDGQGYLKDPTGARRFWPVPAGIIDLPGILRDRDQLWAEAVTRYAAGERWHLADEDVIALAKLEQAARREVHPWEQTIRPWLLGHESCTVAQVLTEALKITPDKHTLVAARDVGRSLRALGWESKAERVGADTVKVFRPIEPVLPLRAPMTGPDDDVPF